MRRFLWVFANVVFWSFVLYVVVHGIGIEIEKRNRPFVEFERMKEEANREIAEDNRKYAESKRKMEEDDRKLAENRRREEAAIHSALAEKKGAGTPPPTPTPKPSARTLNEWTAIIQEDAKLSAIVGMLGKPDIVKAIAGRLMVIWASQLNDGSKNGTALALQIDTVRGEQVIMGIYESVNGVLLKFPWAE